MQNPLRRPAGYILRPERFKKAEEELLRERDAVPAGAAEGRGPVQGRYGYCMVRQFAAVRTEQPDLPAAARCISFRLRSTAGEVGDHPRSSRRDVIHALPDDLAAAGRPADASRYRFLADAFFYMSACIALISEHFMLVCTAGKRPSVYFQHREVPFPVVDPLAGNEFDFRDKSAYAMSDMSRDKRGAFDAAPFSFVVNDQSTAVPLLFHG